MPQIRFTDTAVAKLKADAMTWYSDPAAKGLQFPQTAEQLREAGLAVISVHSPSQNINPTVIIVRWNHVPEGHETQLARHFI